MLKKKIKDEDAFQTPLIGLHLRYPQREENEREREREREKMVHRNETQRNTTGFSGTQ